MNEIICPHCKKVFKVDEAGFADILKQVRDHRFEEELQQRLDLAKQEKVNAIKLAEADLKNLQQAELANKDKEIAELKAKNNNAEIEKQLAINEAVKIIEKERDNLKNDVKTKDLEKQNLENSLKQQHSTELQSKDAIIKHKEDEIARVKDMKLKLSTKMVGETLEKHCEIEFDKLRATAF